ncbi:hypothetical protein TB1_043056 [Malus domestica]
MAFPSMSLRTLRRQAFVRGRSCSRDDNGPDLVLELPSGSGDEGSEEQKVLIVDEGRGHSTPNGSVSLGYGF